MTPKTTLLSLAFVLCSIAGFAQMPNVDQVKTTEAKATNGPAEKAKAFVDRMTSTIHITPDQAKKALPVVEEYFNKLESIHKEDGGKNSAETTTKIQGAKDNLLTKLKGFLSSDQVAKVKDMLMEKMKM